MGSQDRISPYNICTISVAISSRQVMRLKKISVRGLYLVQYQIPQTNVTRTVWQTVRRITNEILGVKGLSQQSCLVAHPAEAYLGFCSMKSTSPSLDGMLFHQRLLPIPLVFCQAEPEVHEQESSPPTVRPPCSSSRLWVKLNSNGNHNGQSEQRYHTERPMKEARVIWTNHTVRKNYTIAALDYFSKQTENIYGNVHKVKPTPVAPCALNLQLAHKTSTLRMGHSAGTRIANQLWKSELLFPLFLKKDQPPNLSLHYWLRKR